jgi:acyl-coenzyme A synthetase/AMP-(fatty) acid ligase/acyl carrier protein
VATYSIPEDPIAAATVPIGRPLDAVTCAIVDETGREVPDGISGVLQVTGGTVSSGYLHDPNLTARAFSHDAVSGAPCYNTGDICRRRADGVIDHLGRHDAQIKTRGMRVHPAEIERVLQAHAAIAEAVAVGRMHRGDTSIVAFVVPRDACAPLDRAALRRDLCERLPDHMVPAQIVVVDSLPLTPNGKIDRQALMSCDIGDVSRDASDATLAPEPAQRLAAIWAEVLGVARIDPNAGFYELGGNSLLAIEVASRLFDEFGVRVPPSVIAAVPSVARLAASLDPQRSIHS